MGSYIVVDASLRPKANGKAVARRLAERIEAAGNNAELVDFRTEALGFCTGCEGCQHTADIWCAQGDAMARLLPRIAAADGMALVAPIYWGDVSAHAKAFIDRLYAFVDWGSPTFSKATRTDRKVAVVMTSRGMSQGSMDGFARGGSGIALRTAGFTDCRVLVLNGLGDPDAVGASPEKLVRVDGIGDWLISKN